MTTTELIQKAHKIASKYLDVTEIGVKIETKYPEETLQIIIFCFYNYKNERQVVITSISSDSPVFSIEENLLQLKGEVSRTARKLYPKSEAFQNTDLEISAPEKSNKKND